MTIRPRRSVLYMPGSNARAIEKARTLPADGVILDLEDAVAPDAKVAAREQVAAAVKQGGFGAREVFIRVNGIDTPWHADDMYAAAHAAHGGHRETDLAMLALFGCPFLDLVLESYQRESPLRDGWRDRVPLHQLHPLAVHAAGHGRGYGVALAEAAEAVLDLAGSDRE